MSDLVAKEDKSVALASAAAGNWKHFEGDQSDILIPRLLLGQFMSELVQKQKLRPGQIYRSTSKEAVAPDGEKVSIIPLHMSKTWVISRKRPGAGKYEFVRIEPFTAQNAQSEWLWQEDGAEWKREQNLNFYVLLPRDIDSDLKIREQIALTGEIPDLDEWLLPAVLSFKSTSFKTGRILATHFAQAADLNLPPFAMTFKLGTEMQTKDTNRFYVFTLEREGRTKAEYLPVARKWWEIVAKTNVRIDEEEPPEMERVHHASQQTQF